VVDATFKGIAFPFQKGETSFPKEAVDEELIADSIFQILSTSKGERLMRPTFGANLHDFVFEDNKPSLAQLMETEARSQIARFEPRVIVTSVTTERADNVVTLTLEYVVKLTKKEQTIKIEIPAPT
jgi:phage baseplate assembly protein W